MKRLNTYPEFCFKALSSLVDDRPAIQDFVGRCPSGEILEIGAGSGRTLDFFSSKPEKFLKVVE